MHLLRRFLAFLRPYRWQMFEVFLLIFVINAFSLWRPAIMGQIIDSVVGAGAGAGAAAEAGPAGTAVRQVWQGVLLLLINTAGMATVSFWRSWRITYVAQRVIFDIRRHLHRHLQKLSMSYYESRQSGRIMARVLYDVDAIGGLAGDTLVQLLTDTVQLVFLIYLMFSNSWPLACIAVITIPLYLGNFMLLRNKIRRAARRVREKFSVISGDLHEKIAAAKVVKSFTRERSESLRFIRHLHDNLILSLDSRRYSIWLGTSGMVLQQVGTATFYLVGCYFIIYGHFDMTVGKFMAFKMWLDMLYGPAQRLIDANDMITRALVAVERIFEILDTKPEVEDAPNPIVPTKVDGLVEFRNVSFGYDPNELVLQNINLEVRPGEMCAFVGPSGSGKTTLANLIARFYDPTSGALYLDGIDLRQLKLTWLRGQIGVVLQETHLFTGTIRSNLRYGNPHATQEQVARAAMAANAHDFIMELPEDYDTEIGERGLKLSGGQRQRIAIARAILRDPRLLILDEATSALDSTSEALIQSALDQLMVGRTSFVIAHRLSTIMKADKIVVLEHGIVVDVGSHDELLDRGGLYAKLYNMQFRKQLLEDEDEDDPTAAQPGRARAGVRPPKPGPT
ncbi:MAG TPA: ABC transporter ATP-binding protein [Armatimonadetes bacterium]|nr:ABC transporter ATP-binding protein [Armatimonadota bacterium]